MKTKFIIVLILIFSAGTPEITAQEIYSLERAIIEGLENNYSIILAKNREEIAANNHTRGNAGQLPWLDATGRYSGTLNNTTQQLTAGGENVSRGVHNTTAAAGASLGWTIFRGFQASTTYEKLGELRAIGELSTQMTVENLIARIVSEYNFYIQQKRLYQNLQFAVDLSRERLRIDEERYLLGAASKLQLLQSSVYLNADSSRLARQNEVLSASEIRLNELMAVGDLAQRTVVTDTALVLNNALSFETLMEETTQMNTALLIARRNQTISEYDYRIIASRAYPYLSLSSGYNTTLNSYSSGNLNSQFTNGMNYGLTMGVTIFDGQNRRREKRNAEIEIANSQIIYQQIEQEVTADLLTIWSAYTNNLRLIDLELQNLATAAENLDIALERYKLGNLSGLDLREVQKSFLDAEERLLSVEYQTKSAEISLMQISGNIMSYLR